jgi:hypothetical protein
MYLDGWLVAGPGLMKNLIPMRVPQPGMENSPAPALPASSFTQVEINVEGLSVQFHIVLLL